jgi:Tfp pilus assembly protein PilF
MAKKRHRGQEPQEAGPGDATAPIIRQDPEPEVPPEYEPLVERLRAGKVVLCTGAALGAPAGRPTWREIVERLLDRLEASADVIDARAMLDTHPLTTSGYVRRSLGSSFRQALAETVGKNGALPEVVQLLSRLPFRAVVTTAFDDLLERAFSQEGKAPRVYTPYEAEEIRRDGRGRYILQVFGNPRNSKDVVFGAGDLQRVLADESFRHLARDLYEKRSFLFLGFDPNDPDFEILIDRIMTGTGVQAGGGEPRHFAVLPGLSRVAQDELLASFGIQVLPGRDLLEVLRLLSGAIGEYAGEVLPDDDDLEGWLRILQQEPSRADALAKLAALEERLVESGDTDRLIELLVGRVEVEAEAPRRAALLRRLSEILEHDKGQMAEAFHFMLAAYKEDPQGGALDELERLAGTTGQWVELLSALREVINAGHLPLPVRADLWVRIARLYGDKLNHLDYALTSLQEAQKLDITDASTRRQLRELRVDLTRRAEKWKDLAEALGQLAAEVAERERRIDLYLEQGDIYETRLSDGVSAAAAFRKALDADERSRDALTALEHLIRRHKNWAELVPLLDKKAKLLHESGDLEGSLNARREAATITTEHLADRRATVERWEAIRREAPRDLEALRALEKLYAQEGSFSEHYLGVLNALADVVTSDKERLALYRRLAAEYEELPGHAAQAAAALEKILDIDPAAEDAYRGLERLYRQDKKWVLLVDTYRRHAQRVQTGRSELYAAIGRIYEVDLPEGHTDQALLAAPQAIEAYSQVLQIEPEHQGAMEALTRLYLLTESYEDALRLLDKRANLATDKAERVALRHQAAQLTAEKLRDYKGAEERFVRALEADPEHVPTMTALVELYRKQGESLRAARLLCEAEQHTGNRLESCTRPSTTASGPRSCT